MLDSIDTIKTKQDIKNKRFSPDYPVEWSCMLFWLLPEDPCAERVWSSLEWLCKECITGTDTRRGNSQWPQTGTKALGGGCVFRLLPEEGSDELSNIFRGLDDNDWFGDDLGEIHLQRQTQG